MQELIQLVSDAALIVDTSGSIIAVNGPLVAMFGHSKDELINQPVELLIPPELREKHQHLVQNYVQQPYKREFGRLQDARGITKSGEELTLDIMLVPVPNATHIIYVVAVLRDTDKIRKITDKMESLLHKLNALN